MKRFGLTAVFTATALLPVIPLPASAEDELTYTSTGRSITITGCAADAVSVTIPAEIDGLPVTAIGADAFSFCETLTDVTLPDSVTSIGSYAFYYCTSLTNLTLPSRLSFIGSYAFSECESLTTLTLPQNTGKLPRGLFSGCDALTAIHVADGNAFCKSVDGVLYGTIDAVDGCDVPLTWLACYPPAKPDAIFTVPDDVETIAAYAFDSCASLTAVSVPSGVQTIEEAAFFGCDALTAFDIADDCTAAQDREGVLFSADGTSLLCYPAGRPDADYAVPEGTASIAPRAFSDAAQLAHVTVPEGITQIDQHVFSGCTALTTLSLPQTLTSFGFYSLYGCDALTDIHFAGTAEAWSQVLLTTSLNGSMEGNEVLNTVTVSFGGTAALPLGDLSDDGTVDASDAAMLLVAAAAQGAGEAHGLTDEQTAAADLDANGVFDAIDAAYILQYAAYAGAGGEMTLEEFLAAL